DISLDPIKNEGNLEVYEITSQEETAERIKNADIVITNKVIINLGKKELEKASNLKLICVAATGYDNINLEEAKKKNIPVANVTGYSTDSVVQMVFSYILTFTNSPLKFDRDVKNGEWSKSHIFTLLNYPIQELKNKKLGIIGYGNIDKKVAEIGKAFGMEILIAKRSGSNLEDILKESDIITIHTPLSDETKNLITEKEFKIMKKDAILINAARGGIVNEEDLYNVLKNKEIKNAAIDVMVEEPPRSGSPLFELDNIIITPHVAWASRAARQAVIDGVAENINKFKEGKIDEINLWSK
ncbi:MAG: D-2-hydroxyacid dehydrogenase, partial [Parcubacteria group bacterium]|nr:D-2-hydroxyacid dehydrogenase [Parcubacteria group bacterium]